MARRSLGPAATDPNQLLTRAEVQALVAAAGGGGGVSQAQLDAVAAPRPVRPICPVGSWMTMEVVSTAGSSWPVNQLWLGPVWLNAGTYDAVALHLYSAAGAGGTVKVVAYSDDNGKPGALALETAAVDATSTGQKQITGLNIVSPSAGRLLWVGTVTQNTTTAAQLSVVNTVHNAVISTGSPDLTAPYARGWYLGGVTGAAPSTGAAATRENRWSYLAFRRSA